MNKLAERQTTDKQSEANSEPWRPGSKVLWERRKELELEKEYPPGGAWIDDGKDYNLIAVVKFFLRIFLTMTGLYKRGERNADSPVLREMDFVFPHLPPELDGFRILHISDLHFDDDRPEFPALLRDFLDPVRADIAVLTGDYRFTGHGDYGHVPQAMATFLEGVHAEHGVIGILGNHDNSAFVQPLVDLGVRMLVNDRIQLEVNGGRMWIAGLDDHHRYGCDDMSGALAGVDPGDFVVLLTHSPELIRQAARMGVDLYLCGHTHGGQICLPGIGPVLLNAFGTPRKYCSGRWRHEGVQGYTTPGLGATALHVRYNCPPEAGLITLRRGTD